VLLVCHRTRLGADEGSASSSCSTDLLLTCSVLAAGRQNRGDCPNLESSKAIEPYVTLFLHPLELHIIRIASILQWWDEWSKNGSSWTGCELKHTVLVKDMLRRPSPP
jgi:hypothetical protein